uniref:Uncharacterized protein AlNc14C239G9447 n=1 Tax=Albugo laibachii Nc14 TaxID=890382 RepID=F0WSV7_9STRA|nr:conserved hypothetical protein [Albugo laibachii Nc14]|eukprot:CCA24440.1 conserved hypothetical protein [Albugo laibachii Nc14]
MSVHLDQSHKSRKETLKSRQNSFSVTTKPTEPIRIKSSSRKGCCTGAYRLLHKMADCVPPIDEESESLTLETVLTKRSQLWSDVDEILNHLSEQSHFPPYMLGERPTPLHGGSGSPSFRQVPFISIHNRVESGIGVRKQLRKYLKASSSTQQIVAQMHLQQATNCVSVIQSQEIAQTCFDAFFQHMKAYNETVGQKHVQASKAFQEMILPFEKPNKLKKWTRDTHQLVQKCVQDVTLLEKRMEKANNRLQKANEDLLHRTSVLKANEATFQIQPNVAEVVKSYQSAIARHTNAENERAQAQESYQDTKHQLFAAIERRDQIVEEVAEYAQSVEEDRLDTMLIVLKQYIETKTAILHAEIEALSGMQQLLKEMERKSVIQQFIVDSMQPQLTHRHAKALYLLEWHGMWHEQQEAKKLEEPNELLRITDSAYDIAKFKVAGISMNDAEVIKDFVLSCFVESERSILRKTVSSRHRNRFSERSSIGMYQVELVRKIFLCCLHHQRTHGLELSIQGYNQLASAMTLLLDACVDNNDTKATLHIMNLAQTFYRQIVLDGSSKKKKEYLHTALQMHSIWSVPQYWGNALLVSIGEELSRQPATSSWFRLSDRERTQQVLRVHHLVFGQVSSFLYNLFSFGFSHKQVLQYVQNVAFAYELGEEQRVALLASVQSSKKQESKKECLIENRHAIQFSSKTLADWTTMSGVMTDDFKLRPLCSTNNSRLEMKSLMIEPVFGNIKSGSEKSLSNNEIASRGNDGTSSDENWEDLFGSTICENVVTSSRSAKTKRRGSRRFQSDLRSNTIGDPSTERFQPFDDSSVHPKSTDNVGWSTNSSAGGQKASKRSSRARSETTIRYNSSDHLSTSNNEIAQMAARLKQRRETSSGIGPTSGAHNDTNPRTIHRSHTSDGLQWIGEHKAAAIDPNHSNSQRSHTQNAIQPQVTYKPPAPNFASEAPLSGVAALRARFEKT